MINFFDLLEVMGQITLVWLWILVMMSITKGAFRSFRKPRKRKSYEEWAQERIEDESIYDE